MTAIVRLATSRSKKARSLHRARRHRVCTPLGYRSDAATLVAHASFWKARTSCSVGDMRSDVLVGAAAAVALVACGFAHSADLRPVVSEPFCFQPNEQLHCLLRLCCDRRVQGRSTRLCRRNRTCGVQLVTRPAKFWRKSEQPWLEKAIAADIANSSEVREGTYAAFPRQRAQFDYRPLDRPRGAVVEQALTPACCIRFDCECMSFGGTASGDLWESSCEPWACQNLKVCVEWSGGRLHPKPHSCCLPRPTGLLWSAQPVPGGTDCFPCLAFVLSGEPAILPSKCG